MRKMKMDRSLLQHLRCREINSESNKVFKQKFQFSDSFVNRLGLEVELNGHQGCVNCLEWAPNGSHLASGSDDTAVILWDVFRHKQIHKIPTPHNGNIFSVKFLADTNIIATGAGDFRVIVQSVENALSGSTPLLDCKCHVGRVKRLATCPDQPTLFWSAGEDGLVYQYDMREQHECFSNTKLLINLSADLEFKCIAVNPTKPHYLAVGANDCFVRLYDRRMLKHTIGPSIMTAPNPQCAQYYSPGHLVREYLNVGDCKLTVTYVAFNSSGSEMLANIGGEQIYLFDVNNPRHVNELQVGQYSPRRNGSYKLNCNCGDAEMSNWKSTEDCACFYMRRAFRAYERKWLSDLYCAARDYLHVIRYWPDHKQAYIGLIRCMIGLKWPEDARDWLEYFLRLYPDYESNSMVKFLTSEITDLKRDLKSEEDKKNGAEDEYMKRVTESEKQLRLDAVDFERRFLGHCNTTTDIKEANFLGEDDNYICAGSDEGIIFIWDKKTTEVVRALFGDISIVNCIQPHPSSCAVASSGIEPAVKIWMPMPEDGVLNTRVVNDVPNVIKANQQRMCMNPFESMLANFGSSLDGPATPTCRTS